MPMMMQSSLLNDSLQKVIYNLYMLNLKRAILPTDFYTFLSMLVSRIQWYIFRLMISPYLSAQTGTVNRSLFTFSTISVLGQYLAYLMLSVYCWLTVGNVLAFC